MAYRNYLIEEIQADGYSQKILTCVSYMIDLINKFQDGIGINENKRIEFQGVQQVIKQINKLRWINRLKYYNTPPSCKRCKINSRFKTRKI